MEANAQDLSSWIVLKVFVAFFLALLGLAMLIGRSDPSMFLGAFFASIGLTYLTLLWIYSHRVVG
jgi:predicted small integral membrane protein